MKRYIIILATVIQRIEAIQAKGGDNEMFDFSELQDLLEEQDKAQEELDNKDNNSTEEDN